MRSELAAALGRLFQTPPQAYAFLYGSEKYPDIHGVVYFYPFFEGTLVAAEAAGLPHMEDACRERVFGFHLHEGALCKGSPASPFEETGPHYNPEGCEHPAHAGDLPPLFGNDGYALCIFYTARFRPDEAAGHTVILHELPDDFTTQPSGASGEKIACGEVQMNPVPFTVLPER